MCAFECLLYIFIIKSCMNLLYFVKIKIFFFLKFMLSYFQLNNYVTIYFHHKLITSRTTHFFIYYIYLIKK